jgi:hypothetical protein
VLLMFIPPQLTQAHVLLNHVLLDIVSHTPTCCYAATEWRYSLTLLTNYHWVALLVRVHDGLCVAATLNCVLMTEHISYLYTCMLKTKYVAARAKTLTDILLYNNTVLADEMMSHAAAATHCSKLLSLLLLLLLVL